MTRRPQISKSNFIKGKQCLKALYLNKYHYEKRDPVSEELQARFDRGHDVGKLAHQLFPGGTMAAFDLPQGFYKSLKFTRSLIEEGVSIIYEAGLQYKNAHCFVDILIKEREKWKLYEVKSSSSISETYFYDAAFQYFIAQNYGLEITDVSLVYVNREYKLDDENAVDVNAFFIIESVFEKVKEIQGYVEKQFEAETQILLKPEIPDIKTGDHCTNPYRCDFMGYCWNNGTTST